MKEFFSFDFWDTLVPMTSRVDLFTVKWLIVQADQANVCLLIQDMLNSTQAPQHKEKQES